MREAILRFFAPLSRPALFCPANRQCSKHSDVIMSGFQDVCHECEKELVDLQGDTGVELKANSVQVGGDHYKSKEIQPWDYITSNNMNFLAGNVVKYVTRYKDKNGVQDLKKARHYLDKLIEEESRRG